MSSIVIVNSTFIRRDAASVPLVQREATTEASDDPLRYVLSDESVDSYGDVINSDGWVLSEFRRNPIALFNHNRDAIVGRWAKVWVENKQLIGQLELAAAGTSALVDYVRALVQQKILRATSVGFVPLEHEPYKENGIRFLRQKLKEVSLVSVPANANAVQLARSFGIRPEDIPAAIDPASSQGVVRRGLLASPASSPSSTSVVRNPKPMSKIAQRIQTMQQQLTAHRDRLTTLSELEERTEQEEAEFTELPGRIEELKKSISNLEAAERALATREAGNEPDPQQQQQQRHVEVSNGGGNLPAVQSRAPIGLPRRRSEPRDYLVRLAAIHLIARATQKPIERILAERYPNDEALPMVLRAVVNPATTTTAGWAAELVQTAVADLLDSLKPVSIYPALAALGTTFTFDRNSGAIRVPARAATPSISGAWVGEGQPIPVRRLGLTSVTLNPKKLAVISTFTSEIAAYSTPAIEGVIREAMADDTAVTIDTTLIDDTAASAIRPAGLRNGVAGLTPSALTDLGLAMIADIKALIGALTAVNGGRRIAILMNPAQGMGVAFAQNKDGDFLFSGTDEAGRRFNVTFIMSTTVTAGMVIAVDAADFATALGTPEYNVSEQAAIHEEDTTPLPISATGTPNTVAAPIRSLWQTDTIGVRMIWPANWAMRRTGMVAWMTSVVW